MNELTNEQMQQQMEDAKIYIQGYLSNPSHQDQVLIIGVAAHHERVHHALSNFNDSFHQVEKPCPIKDIQESIELLKKVFDRDISAIDWAQRLSKIQQLEAKIKFIKPELDFNQIEIYSTELGLRYEEALEKIKEVLLFSSRRVLPYFKDMCLQTSNAFNELSAAAAPFIDNDNRPWYEKAANPGGKKRKQSYHNKHWRK